MNTILALSGVVIKELYRRKDFYVLFVLTAVITLLLGSVSFFNDAKIARYLKEVVLLLIWVAALVIGILLLGRYLNQVALQQPEPLRTIVYTIYFLIPHLEWYDVRDLIIYDHRLVPWVDCLLATLYAAVYAALLLFATWAVFRRKPLSV